MRIPSPALLLAVILGAAAALRAETVFDAAEPIVKVPVPGAPQQQKSEKIIRELFKEEYSKTSPQDKLALAQKLAINGMETRNDNASRYMLWVDAARLAAEAGDLEFMHGAHEKLEAYYTGEFIDLKKSHLTLLSSNTRDAVLSKTALAYKTLLDKPNDPLANLAVGKYLCFGRGDFARGLPVLAKTLHPGLSALAKQELESPLESDDQLALGDAWWDLSEKSDDKDERRQYQQRAVFWYERVLPAQQGLSKVKLEKRIAAFTAAGGVKAQPQAKMELAPRNKAVNLLKKIDVVRDTVKGDWTYENGILSSQPKTRETLFQLPVHPGNQYDFHVMFVSMSDKGDVGFIFPHSKQQVYLSVCGWDNALAGLTLVDEKMAIDNSTKTGNKIERGVRYDLLVQVRPKSIRVMQDGVELVNYKFNVPNFRLLKYMQLRDDQAVGLANWYGASQYFTVEITELTAEQISPAADQLVGRWEGTHPNWHENVQFKTDGSFVVDRRYMTGKWEIKDKALTLRWEGGLGVDQLTQTDANTFSGKNGAFTLKRVTKVKEE